jgi:hypothetical protein
VKLERERAAVDAARKQLEDARAAAAAAAAASEAQEKSKQEVQQQQQLAEARRERDRIQSEQGMRHAQQQDQQLQQEQTPVACHDDAGDRVGSAGGSSPTLKENFFPVQVSLDIRCAALTTSHCTPSRP